ncbi:MAG: hypothetical protein ACPG49_01465 [Chitinophagales bacterium]
MIKFQEIPYIQPDFEALKSDFEALLSALKTEKKAAELWRIFQEINQIHLNFRTAYHLAYILNGRDSSIESHQEKLRYFDTHLPLFHKLIDEFHQILLKHPHRTAIEAKVGKQYFVIIAHNTPQDTSSLDLTPLKQKEQKLISEYRTNLSQRFIDYEGEKTSMGKIFKAMGSPDENIRQKASDALLNHHQQKSPQLEAIFEQLVQIRHQKAIAMDYNNFVELGYLQAQRQEYGVQEIEHFNQLIQKYIVPLHKKMQVQRAKRLKVETLQYRDTALKFPDGNPRIEGDLADAMKKCQSLFSNISPELGLLFKGMLEGGYIDSEMRPNKSPIQQKVTLPNYHISYIFSYWMGRAKNIQVLAHEIGHAFQTYKSEPFNLKAPEYIYPSMDLAEVHSTTLEFLTLAHYSIFFEQLDLKKAHILFVENLVFNLLNRSAYEEFQQKVYENPNSGMKGRNNYWKEIQQKYFPPSNLTPKEEHPYLQSGKRWQKSFHLFTRPFYMVEYNLAYICSMQLWMRSEQEGFEVAWQDYVKLCEKGGSISFLEALELVRLDSPFEETTVRKVTKFLEKWMDQHIGTTITE